MFVQSKNRLRVLLTGILFLMLLSGFTVQAHASWIKNEDGTYSYEKENGKIARDKWIDKQYYVNSKGIRVTGKQKIDSKWYFFSEKGKLQKKKWIDDGECRYYAGEDGALYQKGIYTIKKKKYLFDAKAVMQTGKCTFKKKTYYLLPKNGQMLTDQWVKIDKYYYYFGKDGAMVQSKWLSDFKYYVDAEGRRISGKWKGQRYIGKDGKSYSGLHEISGTYYYFDTKTRKKVTNTLITVKGQRWYFDDDGKGSKNSVPKPGSGVNVQPEYYKHPVVDDETLLSYIIYCEAGNQLYAGKVAVGYVIMNRVYSKLFKETTVREVVYAKKQFNPVWDGAMARVFNNPSIVTEECKKAAKQVIKMRPQFAAGKTVKLKVNGKNINFPYLFFMRLESYKRRGLKSPYNKIGDHVFFTVWK